MDLNLLLGILLGLIGLATAAVTLARYFSRSQLQLDKLTDEIRTLREQNEAIRSNLVQYPTPSAANTFQELTQVVGETAKALGAEVWSVSVPVSLDKPTHLRIIYSSDVQSTKLQSVEIPIKGSTAGYVFTSRQHYIMNEASSDKLHYNGIDKAVGTPTQAMFTLPLSARGSCHGVVQFLRYSGEGFQEERDLPIASRYLAVITQKVVELEESPQQDIPTIARGNTVRTAVLFTDIRAFGEIADKISLNITVSLLNEYYSSLLPIALARRGVLQEYVGDGLYVSFILDSPAASAREAVGCALEMQRAFDDILEGWKRVHPTSPRNAHCIGIATGTAYSGLMGHPKDRREKLVGPVVNLAAHLCEQASMNGGGILLDEETLTLVKPEGYAVKPAQSAHGHKAFELAVWTERMA